MKMAQLLLDDDGVIRRRDWWLGTGVLLAFQFGVGLWADRHLAAGLDRALLLFVSIALLIPFHSLNAKRFRAIGQPSRLALAGGGVALAAMLAGAFLPGHPINIGLGLALLCVILWFAVALGVYDPPPRVPVPVDHAARGA
jgi:uncharacterized membrane protein YhaH (DUF805 family)